MMFFILLFIVLLLLSCLIWWWNHSRILKEFPPGPFCFPFIGYVPFLTEGDFLKSLSDLHNLYGPVLSVSVGPSQRFVYVSDYQIIKEAFKSDSLTSRPLMMDWYNKDFRYADEKGVRGLFYNTGQDWKHQKRFVVKTLSELGIGKSFMQERIQDEILQLFNLLDEEVDTKVAMKQKFNNVVVNTLWKTISGWRFELDDSKLSEIERNISEIINISLTKPIQMMPSLRYIAPNLSGWTRLVSLSKVILNFINETVEHHLDVFLRDQQRGKENPTNFIDAFLTKMHSENSSSSFQSNRGIENLKTTIFDLLIAGSESTATLLTWGILFVTKNSKVQIRMQEELDTVVGSSRLPDWFDKENLQYSRAVVEEILRVGCIGPLGIPRMTNSTITLGKYKVPKGTVVFPNYYYIMHDPNIFTDPEKFYPERFLDKVGQFVKIEQNVAFGQGQRDCLGKNFGTMQLFLMFCALMQRYSFHPANNDVDQLDVTAELGITRFPKPFEVVMKRRKMN